MATLEEIQEAVRQGAGRGTYGEGAISEALGHFRNLKNQLEKGEITQDEFVRIGDSLIPQVKGTITRLYGGGSKSANAAKAAGAEAFMTEIERDFDILKSGKSLLGRDLTKEEIIQARPRFAGGKDTGESYLAELAKVEKSSPKSLASKAGQYTGQVNEIFQSLLGREASANEADYYGRLFATEDISPYEIEALVKRTPEFQTQEDTKFRGSLQDELLGYNREAAGKAREDILSRLKRSGLTTSDDAVAAALAESEEDLQGELNRYLSGLSASQYGGNKELAVGQYQDVLDQFLGSQAYDRRRSDSYVDYLTQRSDSITDYNREMNDYLNFLNQQPKQKKTGLGSMLGTVIGGGIGAAYGQPMAGATMGQAGGGLFDYLLS